jgi:hypothetical protein
VCPDAPAEDPLTRLRLVSLEGQEGPLARDVFHEFVNPSAYQQRLQRREENRKSELCIWCLLARLHAGLMVQLVLVLLLPLLLCSSLPDGVCRSLPAGKAQEVEQPAGLAAAAAAAAGDPSPRPRQQRRRQGLQPPQRAQQYAPAQVIEILDSSDDEEPARPAAPGPAVASGPAARPPLAQLAHQPLAAAGRGAAPAATALVLGARRRAAQGPAATVPAGTSAPRAAPQLNRPPVQSNSASSTNRHRPSQHMLQQQLAQAAMPTPFPAAGARARAAPAAGCSHPAPAQLQLQLLLQGQRNRVEVMPHKAGECRQQLEAAALLPQQRDVSTQQLAAAQEQCRQLKAQLQASQATSTQQLAAAQEQCRQLKAQLQASQATNTQQLAAAQEHCRQFEACLEASKVLEQQKAAASSDKLAAAQQAAAEEQHRADRLQEELRDTRALRGVLEQEQRRVALKAKEQAVQHALQQEQQAAAELCLLQERDQVITEQQELRRELDVLGQQVQQLQQQLAGSSVENRSTSLAQQQEQELQQLRREVAAARAAWPCPTLDAIASLSGVWHSITGRALTVPAGPEALVEHIRQGLAAPTLQQHSVTAEQQEHLAVMRSLLDGGTLVELLQHELQFVLGGGLSTQDAVRLGGLALQLLRQQCAAESRQQQQQQSAGGDGNRRDGSARNRSRERSSRERSSRERSR